MTGVTLLTWTMLAVEINFYKHDIERLILTFVRNVPNQHIIINIAGKK